MSDDNVVEVQFNQNILDFAKAKQKVQESRAVQEMPAQYFLDLALGLIKPLTSNNRVTAQRLGAWFMILAVYFSKKSGADSEGQMITLLREARKNQDIWTTYFDSVLDQKK